MSAAELRLAADRAEADERAAVLATVCSQVGIGLRELQGKGRTAATAKRREVVAWVLCDFRGWTQRAVAKALGRTERQIRAMLRNQRVTSCPNRK